MIKVIKTKIKNTSNIPIITTSTTLFALSGDFATSAEIKSLFIFAIMSTLSISSPHQENYVINTNSYSYKEYH